MSSHWIPRSVFAAVMFAMLPACVSTIPEDAL